MSAFLRKYAVGSGADIWIPIIKRGVVDFAVSADWTPAAGDVKISIDGAAAANIATLPVALTMGNTAGWKFVFSNAELTGKTMLITVADSATKAVEDQAFVIETYGHASAMYVSDFSAALATPTNITAGTITNVTNLTNAPADSSGVTTLLTRVTAAVALASSLTTVEGKIDIIDNVVDAILVDTGTDIPAMLNAIGGYIDTEIGSIITSLSVLDTKINTIDGIVDSILEDTGTTLPASIGDIPTNAELATALGTADDATLAAIAALNNLSAAQVLQQAKDALVFYDLDHLLAVDYNPASKPGVATALLNELIESDGGVSRFTANALEQAPAGGGGGGSLTSDQDAALTRIDRTVKGLASRKDV